MEKLLFDNRPSRWYFSRRRLREKEDHFVAIIPSQIASKFSGSLFFSREVYPRKPRITSSHAKSDAKS